MEKCLKYKILGDNRWHHVKSLIKFYLLSNCDIFDLDVSDLTHISKLWISCNLLKRLPLNRKYVNYIMSDNLKLEGLSEYESFTIEFKC